MNRHLRIGACWMLAHDWLLTDGDSTARRTAEQDRRRQWRCVCISALQVPHTSQLSFLQGRGVTAGARGAIWLLLSTTYVLERGRSSCVLTVVRLESLSPWYVTDSSTDRVCPHGGRKQISSGHLSWRALCIGQRSCRDRCVSRWVVIGPV